MAAVSTRRAVFEGASQVQLAGDGRADITDLSASELERWLSQAGHERYRVDQILSWVYRHQRCDFEAMTNLPRRLRQKLANAFLVGELSLKRAEQSSDGCEKLLFELDDGEEVETVIIPEARRLTLCVSTQVGCAMDCRFCATATMGLRRNLRPGEIVGQVRAAMPRQERPLTNIVFMGMGEPLANYRAVVTAIRTISASWGLGLSQQRITVSTVGLVNQMEKLLSETRVNLAVSLNATSDKLRRQLMPVAARYSVARLLAACRGLPLPRRKRVTFEYVLLRGVNDSLENARRLVTLVRDVRCKVNLIYFNPFPGAPFKPGSSARAEQFRDLLLASGIHASIRESRGRDISAACGQLVTPGRRALAGSKTRPGGG